MVFTGTYHIVNKIVRETPVIRLLSSSPHTKSIVILFYICSDYTQGVTCRWAFTFSFLYKGMTAASIYLRYLGTRYIIVPYPENIASVVHLFRFAIHLRYF